MITSVFEVARVETPLGPVNVGVCCKHGGARTEIFMIEARVSDIPDADVMIPDHMRIDCAMSINLCVTARRDGIVPRIEFLLDAPLKGSPESGEWLDSIAFESGNTTLSLATRDRQWMLTTGIECGLLPVRFSTDDVYASHNWLIQYRDDGIYITPGTLAKGEIVSCPLALVFVTAPDDPENSPRIWPWFAVDAILP